MSRLAQLPPRFPLRNNSPSNHITNTVSHKGDDLLVQPHSHRIPSQGSLLEEQSLWADDPLGDWGTSTRLNSLRRSVSDPVAILESSSTFDFSAFPVDDGIPSPNGLYCETQNTGDKNHSSNGLESGSIYGPNSPRQMKNLTHSESSMVSAIFENINRNPFQYVSVNIPSSSSVSESDVKGDACVASGNLDLDKISRRHTGQRSRVRKLQYIAELERTVNVFQALEADLAAKVASLFQQRAILSLENSALKQKIASLRKEKMMKDGQYQSLKNEVKKLKSNYSRHSKSKSASWFPTDAIERDSTETSWQMLDMGKLNLGENSLPHRQGF